MKTFCVIYLVFALASNLFLASKAQAGLLPLIFEDSTYKNTFAMLDVTTNPGIKKSKLKILRATDPLGYNCGAGLTSSVFTDSEYGIDIYASYWIYGFNAICSVNYDIKSNHFNHRWVVPRTVVASSKFSLLFLKNRDRLFWTSQAGGENLTLNSIKGPQKSSEPRTQYLNNVIHPATATVSANGVDYLITYNLVLKQLQSYRMLSEDAFGLQLSSSVGFPTSKSNYLNSIYPSKDGKELTIMHEDHLTVFSFDTVSGAMVYKYTHQLPFKDQFPENVSVSPSGNRLLISYNSEDNKSRLLLLEKSLTSKFKVVYDTKFNDVVYRGHHFYNEDHFIVKKKGQNLDKLGNFPTFGLGLYKIQSILSKKCFVFQDQKELDEVPGRVISNLRFFGYN